MLTQTDTKRDTARAAPPTRYSRGAGKGLVVGDVPFEVLGGGLGRRISSSTMPVPVEKHHFRKMFKHYF